MVRPDEGTLVLLVSGGGSKADLATDLKWGRQCYMGQYRAEL